MNNEWYTVHFERSIFGREASDVERVALLIAVLYAAGFAFVAGMHIALLLL